MVAGQAFAIPASRGISDWLYVVDSPRPLVTVNIWNSLPAPGSEHYPVPGYDLAPLPGPSPDRVGRQCIASLCSGEYTPDSETLSSQGCAAHWRSCLLGHR